MTTVHQKKATNQPLATHLYYPIGPELPYLETTWDPLEPLGEAGEYYYELFGTSSPPLPLETYKMQVKAEASGTKD